MSPEGRELAVTEKAQNEAKFVRTVASGGGSAHDLTPLVPADGGVAAWGERIVAVVSGQ